MKRYYFLLLLLIATFGLLKSQEASTDLIIDSKVLTIKVKKLSNSYQYSFKQANNSTSMPSFTATNLNLDFLKAFTIEAYKEINGTLSTKAQSDVGSAIDLKFIELFAILINEDADGPLIAEITLKETIPVYTTNNAPATHSLTPEKGYFVFKDGFIEQVVIYGVVKSKSEDPSRVSLTTGVSIPPKTKSKPKSNNSFKFKDDNKYGFTNFYAIGISSIPNIQNIENQTLNIDESRNKIGFIKLGEAIDYTRTPQYGTRDYSPENGEIELVKGQTENLYKSSNQKLLEFKIYSDIVGFAQDNPNGLVQLELEKRIPFATYRNKFTKRTGQSVFSFIDFDFAWTKIENKVKYLKLDYYSPQDLKDSSTYYLDALQVYRYQIFQIGTKLNIWLLESQPLKFDFELNFHANFGYARLLDTIQLQNETMNIDEPLNSIIWGPEIKLIFYPEKRINVSISDKLTRQHFLFNDVNYGYMSQKDGQLIEGSKWFNTLGIDAYYWPSDNGKIFVRYRLNHELYNLYSNFSQFQIGYSMNINTSKKE